MTPKEDLINFKSPYSRRNVAMRAIWNITWFCLVRPFPRKVANRWTILLLKMFGAKVAYTATVYSKAKIFMPWNLVMEDYALIGPGVDCYNAAPVILRRNASVSQYSYLCTASHDVSSPNFILFSKAIEIGERAWVAADAFIGPGVTIGEGAVVGARAAVFKDVEPWTVVGGNPAKFIKKRILQND